LIYKKKKNITWFFFGSFWFLLLWLFRGIFMSDVDFIAISRKFEHGLLSEKKVKAGLRAEELRDKLDPEAAIIELLALGEEAKTCDLADLPRLQFRASLVTTILKKCMPDLRSLEVRDGNQKTTTLIIDMIGKS
jgi:hypothetical protein